MRRTRMHARHVHLLVERTTANATRSRKRKSAGAYDARRANTVKPGLARSREGCVFTLHLRIYSCIHGTALRDDTHLPAATTHQPNPVSIPACATEMSPAAALLTILHSFSPIKPFASRTVKKSL